MACLLPSTTFEPSSSNQKALSRNTMIEDSPQISIRRAPPSKLQARPQIISPMSDNFPTPKASAVFAPIEETPESPGSSCARSERSSIWSKRSSRSEFDEMYDISEGSESESLPIKLSRSVKKHVRGNKNNTRYPSIVIPSPGQWPTIEKLKSSAALSPPIQVNLSPSVLSQLQQRSLRVPSTSSAPSLDGSLTSEELAMSSCPSTPDISQQAGEWDAPIRLDPSAFSVLQHINGEEEHETVEMVIEVPQDAISEMREIVESPPITGRFKLDTQNLQPASVEEADDELSALSVPSPGGFFASLDSSVRRTWSGTETPTTSTATSFYDVPFRASRATQLPTSTATSFYNVPWKTRPENPIEHTIALASPTSEQDPVTARKVLFSPSDVILEVDEIDETYDEKLQQTAAATIDRTALWLTAQNDYMDAVCSEDEVIDSFKDIEDAVPKTPDQVSPVSAANLSDKKTVPSGADKQSSEKRISPIHDGTFWEGWRHAKRSERARDVFQQRQIRAEAEHVRRTSCSKRHVEQLQGRFSISAAKEAAAKSTSPSIFPTYVDDERQQVIARAGRERQALEQLRGSAWHESARSEVNGGTLLTSPIVSSFKGRKDVKILDLAGQVHCSWAWTVAADHPDAEVYTTVASDAEAHVAGSSLDGPLNHFVLAAPRTWELPFEDNFFDVISARNLYSYLRTLWPKGKPADEWDLTLRECLRVLKPGGYLEYDLLDAELVHPEDKAQALGVEFAFNLKTRGYDPCAGKSFLPRLKRAGFGSIKRAWMILPVADVLPRWTDTGKRASQAGFECIIGPNGEVQKYEAAVTGSTKDVRALTGLVGARVWEQWMLKLNSEMGRSEERCLEGVAFAFNLKTRGYDPCAGKSFLPRLKRAGFGSIKRAWMILPVADVLPRWTDTGKRASQAGFECIIGPNGEVQKYEAAVTGSTKDVRALTGLVGARVWEQWMLKLNSEMGRSEERCLEGVAKALEEAGRGQAGWRCLNLVSDLHVMPTSNALTFPFTKVRPGPPYAGGVLTHTSNAITDSSIIFGTSKPTSPPIDHRSVFPKMLFFSFFKTLVNHEVTVELKNDISIRGTLKSVDQYLNIKLDDISVLEEMKYPHLVGRCPVLERKGSVGGSVAIQETERAHESSDQFCCGTVSFLSDMMWAENMQASSLTWCYYRARSRTFSSEEVWCAMYIFQLQPWTHLCWKMLRDERHHKLGLRRRNKDELSTGHEDENIMDCSAKHAVLM
nr:u6 snrna-associated sm-like protein lsm2 [Quercus suber]